MATIQQVWDVRAWIITVLLTVAFGTIGYSWHSITADILTLQEKMDSQSTLSSANGARVDGLSTSVEKIDQRGIRMELQLNEIRNLVIAHSLKDRK